MKILVRISTIDMFGYNGRDNHPLETDAGQVGELMETMMQRFATDPFDDMDFITVKMPDGRTVELVEHEVSAIHFGDPRVMMLFPKPLTCDGCFTTEDYSTVARGDESWITGNPQLCDACCDFAVKDAQENADRKMGDATP